MSATAILPPSTTLPAPSSAEAVAMIGDPVAAQFLWRRAAEIANRPMCLVPGFTDVTERCRVPDSKLGYHHRFAFLMIPDSWGRPTARRIDRHAAAPDASARELHTELGLLLDAFDATLRQSLPFGPESGQTTRRSIPHKASLSRHFVSHARSADRSFDFDLRILIDPTAGAVREIGFCARSCQPSRKPIAIASAFGALHYDTDGHRRWFCTRETIDATFWASGRHLPARGTVHRTANYSGHWAPAAAAPGATPSRPLSLPRPDLSLA